MNPRTNRKLVYESGLERDAAYILMAHPDVADVRDQPPAIDYVDGSGKGHTHTFDFEARMTCGERRAVAVKPEHSVGPSGIEGTLALIREQSPPGSADRIILRTGRQITRIRAANARLIHRAARSRIPADVAVVKACVLTLQGAATIAEVTNVTVPGPAGLLAVLRLISDGVIEAVGTGHITRDTQIRIRRKQQSGEQHDQQ